MADAAAETTLKNIQRREETAIGTVHVCVWVCMAVTLYDVD